MMVEVTAFNIILFGLSWLFGFWMGGKLWHLIKLNVLRYLRGK